MQQEKRATFKRLMVFFIVVNLFFGAGFKACAGSDEHVAEAENALATVSQQAEDLTREPLLIPGSGENVVEDATTSTSTPTTGESEDSSNADAIDANAQSETDGEAETMAVAETESVVVEEVGEEEEVLLLTQITNESSTEDRIKAIIQYCVNVQGLSVEAAAGIAGNIAAESSYDPSEVNSDGYHGLCQWNMSKGGGYWWNSIEKWLTDNGFEWNSFEGQVRAIFECEERKCFDDWCQGELESLTEIDPAVELFAVFYEGCVGGTTRAVYYGIGNCYQGLDTRKSEAKVAYDVYTNDAEYYGIRPYTGN